MRWTTRVDGSARDILRDLDVVQHRVVPKAMSAAINKSAAKIRTDWVKVTRAEAGITAKAVRDVVTIRRARPEAAPSTLIKVLANRIRAIKLRHTFGARGVRFAGRIRQGTFPAIMPSGRDGIWKRTGVFKVMSSGRYVGKRREAIREQYVSLGDVKHALRRVGEHVSKRLFPVFFEREMTHRLRTDR